MSEGLYDNATKRLDLYDSAESGTTGVDMRAVLHGILHTDKQGADVIFRRARMENGTPKKCACRLNHRSQEADKDISCDNCAGMGYYFDDILTKTYINHSQAYSIYKKVKDEGSNQTEYKTCYLEWDFLKESINDGDNVPNRFDRIIQLKKDLAGNILSPTQVREIYEILSVEPYRLDNSGRIEYYRIRIISVIDKSFLV